MATPSQDLGASRKAAVGNPLWLKPEIVTRCARCGDRQPVAVAAVGYRCRSCGADWRWVACGNCDRLDVVREELPAVECAGCHTVHVSWWKTSDSESIAEVVAGRRRSVVAQRRRIWRPWAVLIGLLLGLALLRAWLRVLALGPSG